MLLSPVMADRLKRILGVAVAAMLAVLGTYLPAEAVSREMLTAPRAYVVRGSDGNDTNDCLTEETACATWQGVVNRLDTIDFGGQMVTIQHGDEGGRTFTDPIRIPSLQGGGVLTLRGHATPGETVIDVANVDAIHVNRTEPKMAFQDMTIQARTTTTAWPSGLVVSNGSTVGVGDGVVFGDVPFAHIFVHDRPSILYNLSSSYTIAGSADYHILVSFGSAYMEHDTVTLVGTPHWRGAFLGIVNGGGAQLTAVTFEGTATGQSYSVDGNSTISSGGVVLPGDRPGIETRGGRYY